MKPQHPLLLATDLGTTAIKSIVFDRRGKIVGSSRVNLSIEQPRPGLSEQDPRELWSKSIQAMREAVSRSRCLAEDVAAISFSAQLHGLSVIDKKGDVLLNLITWLDLRAGPQTESIDRVIDPYDLYRRTGCPPICIYPFAKILWLKENRPHILSSAYKLLSAKDFVLYRMFGEPYLDRSVASGSQLLNIERLTWDERVLEALELPADSLPILCNETETVGELPTDSAKRIGLRKGIPVVCGASDASLSSVGLGAVRPGMGAINLGSSGAIRIASGRPVLDSSEEMRFFCYYAALKTWVSGGAINNAGMLLQWFKDNFGSSETMESGRRGLDTFEIMSEEASRVAPGSGNLVVVPFFSGERFPIRDWNTRGVVFGLTYAHGREHLIRALMESVAFTLRSIQDALEEERLSIRELRIGGGGARSTVWRQIVTDVLEKPVARTRVEEASALGAAILGAISVGLYDGLDSAVKGMVRVLRRETPRARASATYRKHYGIYRELYRICQPCFRRLSS